MGAEVIERHELHGRHVRGFEHNRWRDAGIERLFPSFDAKAPSIAGLQTRKMIRGRGPVVPSPAGEHQKFLGHGGAYDVQSVIVGAGRATPVAVEPDHRVRAAISQIFAKYVLRRSHAVCRFLKRVLP